MKPLLHIVYLLAILAISACTNDEAAAPEQDLPTTADLIMQVQNTDRLYTTEYVVHKIVAYDDIVKLRGKILNQKFDLTLPQGSRKVLIPMEAHIKAYIDFSDFSQSNLTIGPDSTVTVTLPDPKVVLTSTRIDHAGIKSFVDVGRSRFSQKELAEFERQGRQAIINTIPDLSIVSDARVDAYRLLLPMIEALGYGPDKITVEFRSDLTPADYLKDLFKQ